MRAIMLILSLLLISCKDSSIIKNNGKKNKDDILNIEGHTFFKVTETDSGKVLLKPCDASIEKYKFYKDTLYHNLGQEYDLIKRISFIKNEGTYIFKGYNFNTKKNEVIQIKKNNSEEYYLEINNQTFIDSLFINKIVLTKEPCIDGDKETNDISEETINFEKDIVSAKSWSNDCKLDESYVYFSVVGGQFVFRQRFSINTKIKKIGNNEFHVLFDNSYMKRPYPDNMENYQDFSATEPIGKMKKKGNAIEFIWYGFYNTKSKKRIHLENPFTKKIETEPIALTKCDD
ncbi:hypothetical protein [Flavobacterium sp. PS2]|uniref:hypothetical protein n=1 Tax=Flavobacterium sp. PS2 TaxID=3384157 RepID=UPI00390CBD55